MCGPQDVGAVRNRADPAMREEVLPWEANRALSTFEQPESLYHGACRGLERI